MSYLDRCGEWGEGLTGTVEGVVVSYLDKCGGGGAGLTGTGVEKGSLTWTGGESGRSYLDRCGGLGEGLIGTCVGSSRVLPGQV